MKYGFIFLLVFSALFHFIGPYIYYKLYGFKSVYQNDPMFSQTIFDNVLLINVIPLSLAAAIVWFLPNTEKIQPYKGKFSYLFYIACVLWSLFFLYKVGGHQGLLQGNLQGTWYTYLGLFLGLGTAYTITVTHVEKANLILLSLCQIFTLLIGGSRSAPVTLIINFFILMGVDFPRKKYIQYLFVILFSVFSSIYLYDLANSFRSSGALEKPSVTSLSDGYKEATQKRQGLLQVVGRISMLEVGMVPIYYKIYKNAPESMAIFYDKYSLRNQFSLLKNYFVPRFIKNKINELYPGFFRQDTFPNQYYRIAFFKQPLENIKSSYMSINIGFPVYVYMYTSSYLLSALIYMVFLVGLYLLIRFLVRKSSIITVIIFYACYEFIVFFDFTQNLVVLLRALLTAFAFGIIYKVISSLVKK